MLSANDFNQLILKCLLALTTRVVYTTEVVGIIDNDGLITAKVRDASRYEP